MAFAPLAASVLAYVTSSTSEHPLEITADAARAAASWAAAVRRRQTAAADDAVATLKTKKWAADMPPTELSCTGKFYKIEAEQALANGTTVTGQWCMQDHRGPDQLTKAEAEGLQFATLNRSPKTVGELGPLDMYGVVYKIDHPNMSGTFLDYDSEGSLRMRHTDEKSAKNESPPPSRDPDRVANGFQYVPYNDSAEVHLHEKVTLTAKWYAQNRWNATDTASDPRSPFFDKERIRKKDLSEGTRRLQEQSLHEQDERGAANVFGGSGALLVTKVNGVAKDQDTPIDMPVIGDVADLARILPYYGAKLVKHGDYLPAPPKELFDIFLISYQLSEDFYNDFVYGGGLPRGIAPDATCTPGEFRFGACGPGLYLEHHLFGHYFTNKEQNLYPMAESTVKPVVLLARQRHPSEACSSGQPCEYDVSAFYLPSGHTIVAYPGVLHDDWTEMGPTGGFTTTLPIATDPNALQADTAFMTNDVPGAVATDLDGAGLTQGAKTRFNLVPTAKAPYHVEVGDAEQSPHPYSTGMGDYHTSVQYAKP